MPSTKGEVEYFPPPSSVRSKPVRDAYVIGLVPMSPVTLVGPVVVMPVLVRSVNPPAVLRLTGSTALVTVTHARSISATILLFCETGGKRAIVAR